jgi:hypothetical protein
LHGSQIQCGASETKCAKKRGSEQVKVKGIFSQPKAPK